MNPLLGIFFHAIGGFTAGSFYAPCKKIKGWAWESFWLILGVFAWIIAPITAAWLVMPTFTDLLQSVPNKVLFWSYFFGVLWGIGGLTYGLTMRYLGLSLGGSVALGFCAMFGSLIPPIYEQFFGLPDSEKTKIITLVTTTSGQITLFGIFVCLLGISICGKAGMMKENDLTDEQKAESVAEFNFTKGILVAIVCGILSACMAYAFQAGSEIQALAVEKGIAPVLSNTPLLVVILLGGFTTNAIWCLWLNLKNKTFSNYTSAKEGSVPKNYLLCLLSGVLWYLQFFFYGMGSTQMGEKYDFASWTLHMAFIIITTNIIGLATKEWKGTNRKTINTVLLGVFTLILSTVIIGLANKF